MGVFKGLSLCINNIAIPSAKVVIKGKLDKAFRTAIVNSSIKFIWFLVGFTIVFIEPFGHKISFLVSGIFFLCLFIWTLYGVSQKILKILPIIAKITKTKSISKGITTYLREKYHQIVYCEFAIAVTSIYSKDIRTIPSFESIVGYYIKYFWKYILLSVISIAFYCLFMNQVVKRIMFKNFTNTSMFELYLYPLFGIWKE